MSHHHRFDSEFWGWVGYLVGSIGYLVMDSLSALNVTMDFNLYNGLYVALACCFLLNSLCYLRLWYCTCPRPIFYDDSFWAEVLNIIASALYVVSAALLCVFPLDTDTPLARAHATVQSGLNFAAVLLFCVDSLLYATALRNETLRYHLTQQASHHQHHHHYSSPSLFRKPSFWSCIICIAASCGYLGTGSMQLFLTLAEASSNPSWTADAVLRSTRTINLLFDAFFSLDALLCAYIWKKGDDSDDDHVDDDESSDGDDVGKKNNDEMAHVVLSGSGSGSSSSSGSDDDFADMRRLLGEDSRPSLLTN